MGKKDFYLEESVLDDFSDDLETVEHPLSDKIFRVGVWVACVAVLIVGARVLYAGGIKGSLYEERARANAGQETIIKAPRGIIYDRYGIPLVSNEPSFHIALNLSALLRNRETIDTTLDDINAIVPIHKEEIKTGIQKADLERQAYYPIARNVPLESVIELKKLHNQAIVIENGFARNYIDAEAFSHVVGFTGLVSQQDLRDNSALFLNDEIGKAGLELQYDALIRGINGKKIQFQDARGNNIGDEEMHSPVAGADIHTTLDAKLQKVFYDALTRRLKELNRTAAVGIAMNPQTGEVLSLISVPGFDTNNITASLFNDPLRPTFNRALSGLYSPGSTIKPLVAFAALEEGIVTPLTSIYSPGYIELPNPYDPSRPSRFLDWKPQGWVNLYSALARSSNVYFYEIGGGFEQQEGLGIARLREYWKKFLLDKKTGIDLPAENYGMLPDPQEKEARTGQMWRIGDTYNVSIGQGDLRITPIELIRYICGIANKGQMPIPFVVQSATSGGTTVYERKPSFDTIDTKNKKNFDEVELGMVSGTTKDYGTAYLLHTIPMTIAGKTGSAQIQNNTKTNAFVVAYAPVPNPQIAILVLIEDAREGSLNAVPVVKEVMGWYYENRIKDGN